ncbi:hypothetical protein APR04_002525 [Promicromonospora umidemergens]|uniref:Intracellular septation protein A n=1 Tax=Promicromonospora umidemergens TaxID=629679 RepID=A0ABP8WVP9_9MICO|nr:hypothetical protein [Promicromonospora umidemergens]MCP2283617.1 hypothetical protein [Promicromonospora umidemergens]
MPTRTATARPGAWAEAVEILAAAWHFFARNYPVALAFGALASVQRFLSVSGTADWAGGVGGELFTAAARFLFVAWLARALLRDRSVEWAEAGARWSAWMSRRWATILASTGLLIVFLIVFKAIPDALAGRVGGIDESTWMSWELAIKNVTVIPFTMVWMTVLLAARPLSPEAALEPPSERSPAG